MSYTLIDRKELTEPASSIQFTGIPQIFTDLVIKLSTRGTDTDVASFPFIHLNGVGTNQSIRTLSSNGTSAASQSISTILWVSNGATSTANTFGSSEIYIPNYTGSTAKSVSIDSVSENNGTAGLQYIVSGLWNVTSPITSITIFNQSPFNHVVGSTVSLYGINRQQAVGLPKAIGGAITFSDGHWVHTFTGSGMFYTQEDIECQYLVVAGGGAGGFSTGGGGGAGGYRSSVVGELSGGLANAERTINLTALNTYNVIIGAGGAAGPVWTNGSDSAFHTITSIGGGRGGNNFVSLPSTGGSGGGATDSLAGAAGTSGQGFAGGANSSWSGIYGAGGGGGAAAVGAIGTPSAGGNGGSGLASSITGTSVIRAGGGGGGTFQGTPLGVGGAGGGGAATVAGTANTGGGGGGSINNSNVNAAGGSGIVIVRYRA
jgi:hypothetical protein